MAEKELKTRIALKRDSEAKLSANNPKLLKGEIFLVDTSAGLKVKIGDGNKTFNQLDYQDFLIHGYYLNNKFYTDSTYTVEIAPSVSNLYLDINASKNTNKCLYYWDGAKYNVTNAEDMASDTNAGIMKLYQVSGQNIDGTMTQKTITDGVNSIKFDVDANDDECLILDLPWD